VSESNKSWGYGVEGLDSVEEGAEELEGDEEGFSSFSPFFRDSDG